MNEDLTNTLPFKLGKLMIALAWADGNLGNDEINAVKNMLFKLKGLSADDWDELEILMENKTAKPEINALLQNVIDAIKRGEDKKLVLGHLKGLIEADGKITKEEQKMYDDIEKAVLEKSTGLLGLLTGFGKNLIKKGASIVQDTEKQEGYIHDFLQNKILYDIKKKFPNSRQFSERQIKKWSSGAGLLGRVAMVDNDFDEAEKRALISIIESRWGVDPEAAYIIGELVKKRIEVGQLDFHKAVHYDSLARSFFEETDYEERKKFIELLFQVANASQKTSFEEIEVIRAISMDLKVSHKDYIEAKLTISREDRSGL